LNTLVVTPGNYTFGDLVRVGVPFPLIVLVSGHHRLQAVGG
jgi:di/tricarboxylate transporter